LDFARGEGAALGLHFVFVYIREAHASDKWPMKWAIEWPEPSSLDARIACARTCDADLHWSPDVEVLVDGMDDGFCYAFGAWPAGGFVLGSGGELLFVCAPPTGEVFFDSEELFESLRSLSASPVCAQAA